MKYDDMMAFTRDPIDIDAIGDGLHPPLLPSVIDAFDGVDMRAVTAAALADPTPKADRTNVADMTFRRRGIQRNLNLISATMLRGRFDHLLEGECDHVG